MVSLTYKKKIGSLSQKLWSQVISSEWVQNIYYRQIRKKNFMKQKIKKNIFVWKYLPSNVF